MPFGACGRVKLDFRYNSRNEISVFNVKLIVVRLCRCSSTGCASIFTTSVSSKKRKTVSNIDFTISYVAVLVGGRFGLSVWPFWSGWWPFWFMAVLDVIRVGKSATDSD